jgi:HSP20 family protein
MTKSQDIATQKKKELDRKAEGTIPAKYFVPATDIYETDEALTIVMEMPGVDKKDVTASIENDTLQVEGRIDPAKYENLEPVYAEYNVGHYARSFALSAQIDRDAIAAEMADGVLTLTLRKAAAARARQIPIG